RDHRHPERHPERHQENRQKRRQVRGEERWQACHTATASSPPVTATANVTSGAPPTAANRSVGASPWLNASRPRGNRPKGVRPRSASWATHWSPVTAGHAQRARSTTGLIQALAAPSSAR